MIFDAAGTFCLPRWQNASAHRNLHNIFGRCFSLLGSYSLIFECQMNWAAACWTRNLMKCIKCHLRRFSHRLNCRTSLPNDASVFFDVINAYETCPKLINSCWSLVFAPIFSQQAPNYRFVLNDWDDDDDVCVCGQWPFFLSLDRDLHATELTISRKLTALLLLIASGGHNFCTIIHRTHTKVLACCHCYANTLTDFRATKSRWICVKRILHANRVCCVLFWHLLSKRNVF